MKMDPLSLEVSLESRLAMVWNEEELGRKHLKTERLHLQICIDICLLNTYGNYQELLLKATKSEHDVKFIEYCS